MLLAILFYTHISKKLATCSCFDSAHCTDKNTSRLFEIIGALTKLLKKCLRCYLTSRIEFHIKTVCKSVDVSTDFHENPTSLKVNQRESSIK